MNDHHRNLLRRNREALLRDLEPSRVASWLYSKGIIGDEDKEEVNAKATIREKGETLLDMLPRKGPQAFDTFCEILREVSPHLEVLLRPVEDKGASEGIDGSTKKPLPSTKQLDPSENSDEADARLFSFGGSSGGSAGKSSGILTDKETIYRMNRMPRGIAVIINNKDFLRSSGMDRYPRNGTDVDRDALKKVLQDKLKFKVDVYNNQTKAEIRRIVKSMATADHSNYDAFIFSILTHGEEGVIYGTDGTIPIRELTADFKFSRSLTGKPKMFFFQACQGHEYMDGMDVTDAPQDTKVSVPAESDFIYAYSTVPGYYSWRNSVNGSWFIQSLTKVFDENAENMDILRMLTRVNAMVSTFKSRTGDYYSDSKRQVSSIVSMLRKELYFFPENIVEQN